MGRAAAVADSSRWATLATPRRVRIGMAQMLVETSAPNETLTRAGEMIACAAAQRCDLVVLPALSGEHAVEPISEAARRAGILVAAGFILNNGSSSAVLISATGERVLQGDEVASTALGTVGLNVVAEDLAMSLPRARQLVEKGARIVLSPCVGSPASDAAWKLAHTKLARRHDLVLVAVSPVGWHSAGGSLTIDAGAVVAEAPLGQNAEAMVIATIWLTPDRGGAATACSQ